MYKTIEELVTKVDERNNDGSISELIGVSIDKCFIKSAANTNGTDLSKYKIIRKNDFAISLMQVSRDGKVPVARLEEYEEAIMSPAYPIFRVKDENIILPEYLEMWFKRPEFDREAAFIAVGGVRGSMPWEDFAKMKLPVPSIDEQKDIVKSYRTVTDRIVLKQKINDNLLMTLQVTYKKMFIESKNTYVTKPLVDLCSKIGSGSTPRGGKAAYSGDGISLVRSMNVFDYYFSYSELAHISQEQANALANVEIQQADILFNITGVSVTRCCIVPDDILPARVNQHVMIIRPYKGKLMSYYIMCTLCDFENKTKLLGISQSGSTREAINKQELEKFEIPVPSDEELKKFETIATKIYSIIFSNIKEIQTLCKIKDILLTALSSR